MTGVEVLASEVALYLVRNLHRVGGHPVVEADQRMDALHDLVFGALGEVPALVELREQASAGGESAGTVQWATSTIAEAARADPGFAHQLQQLMQELQSHDGSSGDAATRGIILTGDGARNTQMRSDASESGRVYQAGRDQAIYER